MQDGSDSGAAAETLGEFVGDVAGIEVGEDENIGKPPHRRSRSFARRDLGDQGGIELKLAVRNQVGRPRAAGLGGFPDRRRQGVVGAPLGRKRQHGHSRLDFEEGARVLRCGQRNLRELGGARLRRDGAIRKEAGAIRADVLLWRDHQEEARAEGS